MSWIVGWVKSPYGAGRERIEYEAGPRHADLIIHQLGFSSPSRGVSTPSEKSKPGVDHSPALSNTDRTLYRSATVLLCFLALDRPNLQFPKKDLARWMQGPTVGDSEPLKRIARYLIGHGCAIPESFRQVEEATYVAVCADSDHAICLRTRERTHLKIVYGSPRATFDQHHASGDFFELGWIRV